MRPPNRACLSAFILCCTPLSAYADSGWNGLGMFLMFGLYPLLALLAAFLASLFISRRPWIHKVWNGLAIACSLMAMLMLAGSHSVALPDYAVPLLWILPAAAWAGMSRWLTRRR